MKLRNCFVCDVFLIFLIFLIAHFIHVPHILIYTYQDKEKEFDLNIFSLVSIILLIVFLSFHIQFHKKISINGAFP